MVLVHGNMMSSRGYHRVIPGLEADYKIFAPDLRGFGRSSYNSSFNSLEELADDLEDFAKQLDLGQIFLVGWSLGGGVAMKWAARNPQRIKKLILTHPVGASGLGVMRKAADGTPTKVRMQSLEELSRDPFTCSAIAAVENKNTEMIKGMFKGGIFTGKIIPSDEELQAIAEESCLQRSLAEATWSLNTFNITNKSNGVVEGNEDASKITTDTLIIAGRKDIICSVDSLTELKSILGDNASLKIFEESGHSCFDDATTQTIDLFKQFFS